VLLHQLVTRAKRTGRRIVLVLDQGNPHHAKVIHRDLEQARPHVGALWLPHYSPELNLIEMLWRHLKRTRLANVLFTGYDDLRNHVQRTLTQFAAEPDFTLGVMKQTTTFPIRRNLCGVT
jgi:transposase